MAICRIFICDSCDNRSEVMVDETWPEGWVEVCVYAADEDDHRYIVYCDHCAYATGLVP